MLNVMVTELSKFDHNGGAGAFRNCVKTIALHRLRDFLAERERSTDVAGSDVLDRWADPHGELSVLWEQEHDRFILNRALELIEPEFEPGTWQAFRRTPIDGCKAATVAEELGDSTNAVLVAQSRVLARLRREFSGPAESERFSERARLSAALSL